MQNVTELVFEEQFRYLSEVAAHRGWPVTELRGPGFQLVLPARDGTAFGVNVLCDAYPGMPPAWRWCNPDSGVCDQACDIPRGNGYFHTSGRICAPWNRLAYRQVDPHGPHGDWQLNNWLSNRATGSCTTLAAMALRMAVELRSPRYHGRQG